MARQNGVLHGALSRGHSSWQVMSLTEKLGKPMGAAVCEFVPEMFRFAETTHVALERELDMGDGALLDRQPRLIEPRRWGGRTQDLGQTHRGCMLCVVSHFPHACAPREQARLTWRTILAKILSEAERQWQRSARGNGRCQFDNVQRQPRRPRLRSELALKFARFLGGEGSHAAVSVVLAPGGGVDRWICSNRGMRCGLTLEPLNRADPKADLPCHLADTDASSRRGALGKQAGQASRCRTLPDTCRPGEF
jgi:hypothetical protein